MDLRDTAYVRTFLKLKLNFEGIQSHLCYDQAVDTLIVVKNRL
jgi:hypothetical protein